MEKKYKLTTESMCIWNGNLYFVPRECPILCKWDLTSAHYEIIGEIPCENAIRERLFDGMCFLEGKLILAPHNAEKIWMYDIELNIWEGVGLDGVCSSDRNAKYVGCKACGGYAYFFGYEAKNIIRMNSNGVVEEVEIKNDGTKGAFWGQSVAIADRRIMVANLKERRICQINIDTGNAEYTSMGDELLESCGVTYFNKTFYLAPYKGNKLFVVDENNKSTMTELPKDYSVDKNFLNGVVVSEQAILLFSPLGESLIIRDFDSGCSFEKFGFIRYAIYDETIGFIISRNGCIEVFNSSMDLESSRS